MIKNKILSLMASSLALLFIQSATAQTVFTVATAQDLQNALTTAAGNGAGTNIIELANGYYTGNFNYNSASGDNSSLVIEPEPGLASTNITIDGAGLGRDVNITSAGSSGYVTVTGITFLRNCGNYNIGALRIAAATGGNITVNNCQFLMLTNQEGMGLEIAAGQNTTMFNCNIQGFNNSGGSYDENGNGVNISGVSGTTLLYNDTISGNFDSYGANITASSIFTVSNNVIQGNSEGGIYAAPSSGSAQASLVGNIINYNSDDGADLRNFNVFFISNNVVVGNYNGNGMYAGEGSTAIVVNNTFENNSAYYGGAGLELSGVTSATVVNNTFTGNVTAYPYEEDLGNGGGANFSGVTTLSLVGNSFNGNIAADGDVGGGAYINGGNLVTVSNNTFTANECAGAEAGGLYVDISGGYATLIENTFIGNSAAGGGGAYLYQATSYVIGNTFEQNSSSSGGGAIYVTSANVTLSDNLVVNNSQSGAGATGGGIFASPSAALWMINNTVFGNTSGGGGGGVAFQTSGTQSLYVFNNIIWGNSATGNGADVYLGGGGSQTEFLYNDVDSPNNMYGVWDIAQNLLYVDPQFFNPVGGDYHFPESSPCANTGTNGAPARPLTDLDGNNRTNSAGQIDLGCYEFNNTAPHPADTNGVFTITENEFIAYAAAWKNGQSWTNFTSGPNPIPIPANYLTRAGYLMTNGGAYTNDGSARPTNWKLAQ